MNLGLALRASRVCLHAQDHRDQPIAGPSKEATVINSPHDDNTRINAPKALRDDDQRSDEESLDIGAVG